MTNHRLPSTLFVFGIFLALIFNWAPGEPSGWGKEDEFHDLLRNKTLSQIDNGEAPYELLTFPSGSDTLVGRLYLPVDQRSNETSSLPPSSSSSSQLPPIVIMGHGLGLVQDAKLTPFIEHFRNEGLAVMTFDYATFGWSGGWPRHQVRPHRRVADWQAALAYVKQQHHRVDATRIGLWGTSLGGGHVLNVAADDDTTTDIKAVIANVPVVQSGLETVFSSIRLDPINSLIGLLKVSGTILKWSLQEAVCQIQSSYDDKSASCPLYIPLHGPPGSAAVMQNPGDSEGYSRLAEDLPAGIRWKNLVSVNSVLPLLWYRPYNVVKRISAATLFLAAEHDRLCPAGAVVKAVGEMNPNTAKYLLLSGLNHFDVYDGEGLQTILEESGRFFRATLGPIKT